MLAPERSAEMLEAEQMILDTVRKLVKEKVEPRAAEIDAKGEYPKDLRDLFAKNDLLGIALPERVRRPGQFRHLCEGRRRDLQGVRVLGADRRSPRARRVADHDRRD